MLELLQLINIKNLNHISIKQVDRTAGTDYLSETDCYDPTKGNSECWQLDAPYSKITCDASLYLSQAEKYRNCSMSKYLDIKFQGIFQEVHYTQEHR